MKHLYIEGSDKTKPTLLLLHGTGGSEHDLLPLAEHIDRTASVLSVRGNVLENGMPRFFRRLSEGIFDEEDLIYRTKEMYEFINDAAEKYEFDRDNIVAIGYSNGANIAASLLIHYEKALKGAILLHPMVPRRGIELPTLKDTHVFISAGTNDPICSREESEELKQMFENNGADVFLNWENSGHLLTLKEIDAAKMWYERFF